LPRSAGGGGDRLLGTQFHYEAVGVDVVFWTLMASPEERPAIALAEN
jgi:hypothetical protein